MATQAVFVGTPKEWMAQVSVANTNRDGSGTVVDLVTGATNGTRIDAVRVQAAGTTTAGVIRVFVYDGTNTRLEREILVNAVTPSTSIEAFSADRPLPFPIVLQTGWKLRVSTNNAETFNVFALGGDY